MTASLSFLAAITAATVTLAPADRGVVVAEVGARRLTLGMVADRLERRPAFTLKRFSDPVTLEAFVEEILDTWVLMAEARARGLAEDPAVLMMEKQVAIEEMKRTLEEDLETLLARLRAERPVITHPALLSKLRFDGSAPREPGADAALVVAEAPGLSVPLGMLQAYVDSLPEDALDVVSTERGRAKMLRNAVDFELLAAEATRRGFHLSEAVTFARESALVETLMMRTVEAVDRAGVPEAAARAWYAAHLHEFDAPAALRLRRVIAPDKKTAKKWARALAGKPAADWRAIWETTPEGAEASGEAGAPGERFEVGWYTEAGEPLAGASADPRSASGESPIPPEAVNAAWKLGGAGAATVLAVDGVLYVVGVVAVRAALHRPFETVRERCTLAAAGEMAAAALEELKGAAEKRTPVRRHLARLSAIRIE